MAEITQDNGAMLPAGDFERLEKREREAFHALQEGIVAELLKASNDFQLRHPGLRVEWRFQVVVYQTLTQGPSTIRYSQRVF